MKCPNCSEVMEREDGYHYFAAPLSGSPKYDAVNKEKRTTDNLDDVRSPDAEYQCGSCGLTAHWQRKKPLLITFDPRTGDARTAQTTRQNSESYNAESHQSFRVPSESINSESTCRQCHHLLHSAGNCDRCNCGEDEIIRSSASFRSTTIEEMRMYA